MNSTLVCTVEQCISVHCLTSVFFLKKNIKMLKNLIHLKKIVDSALMCIVHANCTV